MELALQRGLCSSAHERWRPVPAASGRTCKVPARIRAPRHFPSHMAIVPPGDFQRWGGCADTFLLSAVCSDFLHLVPRRRGGWDEITCGVRGGGLWHTRHLLVETGSSDSVKMRAVELLRTSLQQLACPMLGQRRVVSRGHRHTMFVMTSTEVGSPSTVAALACPSCPLAAAAAAAAATDMLRSCTS